MIGPVRGEIQSVRYVQSWTQELAVVEEKVGEVLFVLLHGRGECGWHLIEEYQLGFLEVYPDWFVAEHGDIVDVGVSVSRGEDVMAVVEKTALGKWYLFYEVDLEGFWVIEEELFVADAI